jgi:hypothetical protein
MGEPLHKIPLPLYSGNNPEGWLKRFDKAASVNKLEEQTKLDVVPFYLPENIGDWVMAKEFDTWTAFCGAFEDRYIIKTSKVDMLSSLLSIKQSPSELPRDYLARWESSVFTYQAQNQHGVPELVLVQSFVSGLHNVTLKQLMIDKLNASSTVDRAIKTFSLLITHHCGLTMNVVESQEPTASNDKYDTLIQGMTNMFAKMDTFLSQSKSSGGSASRQSRCFNCKSEGHHAQDCPKPCKYCQSSSHKHYQCNDPKAVAARQYHQQKSVSSDSMLIDVLAATKRHKPDPPPQKKQKNQNVDTGNRTVIKVDELGKRKVKIPSQVLNDSAIDVVELVHRPIIQLSLAQLAHSSPTIRSQLKEALTKRYIKKMDTSLTESKSLPKGNCAPWTIGTINSVETPILLDGGSVVDIMCLDFVKFLGIKELLPSSTVINVANGTSAYPVGEIEELEISLCGHVAQLENVLVFENLPYDCLIGRTTMHCLGITTDWSSHAWKIKGSPMDVDYVRALTVPRLANDDDTDSESDKTDNLDDDDDDHIDGYLISLAHVSPPGSVGLDALAVDEPADASSDQFGSIFDVIKENSVLDEQQKSALCALVRENMDVFGTNYSHLKKTNLLKLEVNTAEATPIYRKPHLNLSYNERRYLQQELESMVQNGILIPSTYGPNSGWSFPVRFVPKKNGDKRLVTQFQALNAVTVRDPFPLPSIVDLLDDLAGASWLSALDLLKGFHQIGVHPDSVDKLTITTPFGNFSYTAMPFGIVNGPSVFSRMIAMALGPLHGRAMAYIDDITVYSTDFDAHLDDLASVFARMKECNLVLNPNKCCLAVKKLNLLGFVVDVERGISPQQDRLLCLESFPVPQNVTDVRAYLGFVGYFRRHIPCFADVAFPLSSLLSKSAAFIWTIQQQQAMDSMKKLLVESAALMIPDDSRPFELYTDASNVAIGAALVQDTRPVAFISRKLKQAELNYPIVEKEILAIVYSFAKLRKYLIDKPFTLYTDNKAVRFILNKAEPLPRLQRWTLALQEFTFSVEHISGKTNVVADVLSRFPPPLVADIPSAEESLYHGLLVIPALYEPYLQDIFDHLTVCVDFSDSRIVRRAAGYIVLNQRLFRQIGNRLVYVPPLDERSGVIKHLHDGHGHFGIQSTWARLYHTHWWPSAFQDVKDYIARCIPCGVYAPVKKQPSLGHVPVSSLFQRFSIDFIGPLPTSSSGNRYILLAVEAFTRYPIAVASPKSDSITVANFLYSHIFAHYGPPLELLSDNGTHFLNHTVNEFLDIIQTKHKFSTPYHPQCNGQVESINGTLVKALKKMAMDVMKDWDSYLPTVLYSYRTKCHSYLRISPYELLYGQHPRPAHPDLLDVLGKKYGWERLVSLMPLRDHALQLEFSHPRAGTRFPSLLPVGTKVMIPNFRKHKQDKLAGNYLPEHFTVVASFENNTYQLVYSDGKPLNRRVNGTLLKVLA